MICLFVFFFSSSFSLVQIQIVANSAEIWVFDTTHSRSFFFPFFSSLFYFVCSVIYLSFHISILFCIVYDEIKLDLIYDPISLQLFLKKLFLMRFKDNFKWVYQPTNQRLFTSYIQKWRFFLFKAKQRDNIQLDWQWTLDLTRTGCRMKSILCRAQCCA